MTHRLGTCGLGTRRSESQEAAFTEERGSCRPRACWGGDWAPQGEPPPAGQHLPFQPWPQSMALHGLGCLTKGPPKMTFLCPDAREVGCTAFRKGFREERGATSPPAPAGSLRAEELKILSPREERDLSPGPKKELCTPHPRCKCKPLSHRNRVLRCSPAVASHDGSDACRGVSGFTNRVLSSPWEAVGVKGSVVLTRATTQMPLENVTARERSRSQTTPPRLGREGEGTRGFFWGEGNVRELDAAGGLSVAR